MRMNSSNSETFKGDTMLRRAEELTTVWAYKTGQIQSSEDIVLLDNVQFIYELALAELELESFGAKFEITNGLRKFRLQSLPGKEEMVHRLAYFRSVKGEETDYFKIIQFNQTRSVNQYLTHWIYPYKGKFHPQMIRALLNCLGLKPGETVLDPFIGSGTTALEAQLLGVNTFGVDVSPLCVMQGKVKTQSMDLIPEIEEARNVVQGVDVTQFGEEPNLDKAIDSIQDEGARNFYMIAKLISVSDNARRGKALMKSFSTNLELMTASVKDYITAREQLNLKLGAVDIRQGDARNLPLQENQIDGIITSPPYSIALDYVDNDKHSLQAMGFKVDEIREDFIGVRGTGNRRIELYEDDMRKCLAEMYRVLRPSRFAAIVVGNATYQGSEVETVQFTIKEAEKLGFKLVKNMDKIIFGLYNVMRKESILIFQKP
jgi:tRNA G10  N-methylase Trm11